MVGAKDPRNDTYILGRVLQYHPTKQKYVVEDADPTLPPSAQRRHFDCPLNGLLPLRDQPTEYTPRTLVYAMFPDTLTFYPARVVKPPSQSDGRSYIVLFDDDADDETGKTPERAIDKSYVVAAKTK